MPSVRAIDDHERTIKKFEICLGINFQLVENRIPRGKYMKSKASELHERLSSTDAWWHHVSVSSKILSKHRTKSCRHLPTWMLHWAMASCPIISCCPDDNDDYSVLRLGPLRTWWKHSMLSGEYSLVFIPLNSNAMHVPFLKDCKQTQHVP